MRVIAIVGLSGVGKSTLIAAVSDHTPFLHLQASALIKAEQEFRASLKQNSEELRLGAVLSNQSLLVAAFLRATKDVTGLVVFDSHTLIDGKDGLVQIPASVFADVGCKHMAVILDEPSKISDRRRTDVARSRPFPPESALAEHQELALKAARRIAQALSIPITIHSPQALDEIKVLLVEQLKLSSPNAPCER